MKIPKSKYAFIDGSYNPDTKTYGYGGFLVDWWGIRHILQGSGNDPELAKLRNVAGEIMGAKAAIQLATDLGLRSLVIFYDYDGIAKWPTKQWKCKNKHTARYARFVKDMVIRMKIDITFCHVKSHIGIEGNEIADRLAREAVGLSAIRRKRS